MKFKIPGWTVVVLQAIFDMKRLDKLHNTIRQLPNGSTGQVVANMLDERNFRLIPIFPNHDLKHAVLEYEMKMEDEIKMQAYLVGNGNSTWPCLLFLSLGVFRPTIWKDLLTHYNQGKNSPSIFNLKLCDVMHVPIEELRNTYGRKIITNKTFTPISSGYSDTEAGKYNQLKTWTGKIIPKEIL